jgi:hypothetical protein
MRIQTEMPSSTIESRNGMRQPQASKASSPSAQAAAEDHQQRQEQAERRGGLDPAGVQAALSRRRVLGDVGGGAAVLAAERQALQQAQRDQRRIGASDADAGVVGSTPTSEGRQAHQHDGDEEGVLAPDQVAEPAEHERAERPHREAGGEGQQGEDEAAGSTPRRTAWR